MGISCTCMFKMWQEDTVQKNICKKKKNIAPCNVCQIAVQVYAQFI